MSTVTHPATQKELIAQLVERVSSLEKLIKGNSVSASDWMTPEQIEDEFGYRPATIRKFRYDGTLTKFKCTRGGRKHKYSRKEIQQKLLLKIV
jgi:hypothetical protein